jgi:hypothetical protein
LSTNIPRSLTTAALRADCAKCCGLCCVGPAFDAMQGFGFDKPAHTACANLRTDFSCAIHHQLQLQGFPACAAFDCYGAGQRVTQRLFGGRSWRSSPEIAPMMFKAYARYRALHELMGMLDLAIQQASEPIGKQLRDLLIHIDTLCESGEALSDAVNVEELRKEVLRWIRDHPDAKRIEPRSLR